MGTYAFTFTASAGSYVGTLVGDITAGSSTEVPAATLTDSANTIGEVVLTSTWDDADNVIIEDTSTQFTVSYDVNGFTPLNSTIVVDITTGATTSSPTTVSNTSSWTIGSWSAPGGGVQWRATLTKTAPASGEAGTIVFATTPSTSGSLGLSATYDSQGVEQTSSTDTLTVSAAAAPTYQAIGTKAEGIGAVSPAWPAHATGDIALLYVETDGAEAATLSTAAGFAELAHYESTSGSQDTRITVFWCRATSGAMGAPTVADSGNHNLAVILTARGCVASGNPWDVYAGDGANTASTGVTIPGATTTVGNTLVVLAIANADAWDAASWTNANLSGITERFDDYSGLGSNGGLSIATGTWASSGAYGNSTATLGGSTKQARISIALKA